MNEVFLKMSFFKKLKDTVKETGLINEYCDYLRQIGVNATIVESGSSEAVSGFTSLGCVKIEGKDIDLVQVARQPLGGDTLRALYQYHYIVRAKVEGLEDRLKAQAKPVTKGLFSKEVVDLKWEGGELAGLLNADSELKKTMLKEELDKMVLKVDKKQQYVSITHPPKIPRQWSVGIGNLPMIPIGGGTRIGRTDFPSIDEFEAYNRIAQHIRSIAVAKP